VVIRAALYAGQLHMRLSSSLSAMDPSSSKPIQSDTFHNALSLSVSCIVILHFTSTFVLVPDNNLRMGASI